MAFCTECGANVPNNIRFCTECGKPMAQAQPQMMNAPMPPRPPTLAAAQPGAWTQASNPQTPPAFRGEADAPPGRDSKYAVMGMGAYIGMMLLFCIPVVGWVICIVIAFSAANLNRRNFARANLVFLIIGLLLCIALYFVFSWIMEAVMAYLNEATQGTLGSLGNPGDFFNIMNGAGLSGQ